MSETMRVSRAQVKALCDELRGKTGLTDELTVGQAALDLASMSSVPRGIPSYVYEEAQRVAARVKAVQTSDAVTIIDISDMHLSVAAKDTASQTHACMAAYLLSVLCSADFAAVHGDNTRGSSSADTLETMLSDFMAANRIIAYFDPQARLYGNHEFHPYVQAAFAELKEVARNYIDRFSHGVTRPDEEAERGYFYADLAEKKTRIICLNTSDMLDVPLDGKVDNVNLDGCFVSAAQLRWLASVLDTSDKGDGWHIVLLSHHPITWGKRYPKNNISQLLTMLTAYNNGTAGSVTESLGETIAYDFGGKNKAPILVNIHGHLHNMVARRDTDSGIWAICTPNACLGRNNEIKGNDTSTTAQEWFWDTDTPKLTKTANSYADTALTVNVIDPVSKTLHSICYGLGDGSGYGRDRTLALGGNYIVTLNLVKVSADNTVTSVSPDTAYTVTLTSAENYSVDTVTVTMGGVDVTADVYADGVVSIPSVTGDVVITATAVWSPTIEYDNLLDTAVGSDGNLYGNDYNGDGAADGYLLGYELNEPATEYTITANSGAVTTGFFQIAGGVPVYIKGVNIPSDANFRIVADTDSALPGKGFWYNVTGFESYFAVEKLDDRLYKLTVTEHGAKTGTFIRFSTISDVQGDFIVTTTDITQIPDEPTEDTEGTAVDISAVGYEDGKRWSTSSGNTSSASGFTAIGTTKPIEFGGETTANGNRFVLNLGGEVDWTADSNCTFYLINDLGGSFGGYLNSAGDVASNGYKITHNGDGSLTMEIYDGTSANRREYKAIKVAGKGSGADAVISWRKV